MKTHGFILFLTLALGIYLLVNSYIFLRGWQASSWMGTFRYLALALFLSSVFSYPASRLSAGFLAPGVIRFFSYVGSFYLAAMAYLFLALLVIDLVRMANHMVPFLPGATGGPSYPLQKIVFFGLIGGLMTVIGVGHLNTLHPQIRTL